MDKDKAALITFLTIGAMAMGKSEEIMKDLDNEGIKGKAKWRKKKGKKRR